MPFPPWANAGTTGKVAINGWGARWMEKSGDSGNIDELLSRLPAEVANSFTPEQRAALRAVGQPITWKRHPVDIRLTLPPLGRRRFLRIVGGWEKRCAARLYRDGRVHPLHTLGNILFLLGIVTVFLLLAALAMAVIQSVVQF
jgi:hypothetical protein